MAFLLLHNYTDFIKKSFDMSFGILEKLDIKVVLLEIDLEIYPLLFNKKSFANCDLPTPFFPTI